MRPEGLFPQRAEHFFLLAIRLRAFASSSAALASAFCLLSSRLSSNSSRLNTLITRGWMKDIGIVKVRLILL